MLERTIVLPTRDNNGRTLAKQAQQTLGELLAIAGGYSELRQRGVWQDGGKVYRDESLRIVCVVSEKQDAAIVEKLPSWCKRLRQVCLYTHTTNIQAMFVYQDNVSKSA